MEAKAGGMEYVDMSTGGHKSPDYTAINPYGQVPAMKDGDVKMGESSAILRYIALKYKKDAYPTDDPAKCAKIDFAVDAVVDYIYKYHAQSVYVVLGFASPHDGQAAAVKSYVEACAQWVATFVGSDAFVGGATPTIADYKAVPFFYAAMQPVMKEKLKLELPATVTAYVERFFAKVGASQFMESAGGWSIKEFAASKA